MLEQKRFAGRHLLIFYTRMKRYWGENISIYRMRKLLFTILNVKLFLKQGISRQLGRGWTQLFDLNARIQQLTWSLIFYEKYSTNQSYLWVWTPLIFFGGFSNFYRYYTRSQTGKSTGYRPTLFIYLFIQIQILIGFQPNRFGTVSDSPQN
jgi:hypothetical protein